MHMVQTKKTLVNLLLQWRFEVYDLALLLRSCKHVSDKLPLSTVHLYCTGFTSA